MRKTNTFNEQEELFAKECKPINLKYEYGTDYDGAEEWAIITKLSEKELLKKYPEQIKEYIPFILLSLEQGEAIIESNQNEDKFRKRSKNNGDAFGYDDDLTERFHPEAIEPDFLVKQELDEYELQRYQKKMELIEKAISSLTEKQHKYLVARFIEGKSAREIAKEEGVSHQVIDRHLIAGIKKFEKIFEGFFRK